MKPFVRQDSKVFIRKQFGIAGAAYLDITRGVGPPLDWDYAVLTAGEETAPTASVGELIEDVREKVLPVVDDTQRSIAAAADLLESLSDPGGSLQTALADLAEVSGKISAGEGNVGRLIVDDSLAREVEAVVAEARTTIAAFSTVVANLEAASGDVAGMAASFSTQSEKLPAMLDTTGETLETLNAFVDELSETLPEVTDVVRNSADASQSVPTLLVQTQQTLSELEQLLIQLRGNWLLGGAGDRQRIDRLSPVEARP
jgi:phospholipid/cholesterol/gamma-HCH transport system substrate-binding protein